MYVASFSAVTRGLKYLITFVFNTADICTYIQCANLKLVHVVSDF